MVRRGIALAVAAGASAAALLCCSSFGSDDAPTSPATDGGADERATGDATLDVADAHAPRRIYVVGGEGPAASDEIFAATVLDDGALGAWEITGHLPEALHQMTAGASGDTLVVAGGRWQTEPQENAPASSVVLQRVDAGFVAFPPKHPFGYRFLPKGVVVHGRLYVSGGLGAVDGGEVLVADVSAEPTWHATEAMPGTRYDHGLAASGDLLFAAGGRAPTDDAGGNEQAMATVVVSKVLADGSLAPWSTTQALPYADYAHGVVAHGGYLFIVGGQNAFEPSLAKGLVRSAKIDADGGLAPWGVVAEVPPSGRFGHGTIVVGDHVYVIGGVVAGNIATDVWSAHFDGRGGVDAWQQVSSLPAPRSYAAVVAF